MAGNIRGLIAAVHSPCDYDFKLNTAIIPGLVDYLIDTGVQGLYVCGTTGEGASLTIGERKRVAESYIDAAGGKIPVIVQVGTDCITSSRELVKHAVACGADAIAAIAPTYFKVESLDILIEVLQVMTEEYRDFPFYYYHLPGLTGLNFDMLEFLKKGEVLLPGLAGIKYSALDVHGVQSCAAYGNGKYSILFGCDEMLISGLTAGASGAVGSTFNFAAPLYHRIVSAVKSGDLKSAGDLQSLSCDMVRVMSRYGLQPAMKSAMSLVGMDLGPYRLPLKALNKEEMENLRWELSEIGFFEWSKFSGEEVDSALPAFSV